MHIFEPENKSVPIHSAKTGKTLCRIEAPQKLWLLLDNTHQVWKHPDWVEGWAWRQALITSLYFNKYIDNPTYPPKDFRCLCLNCNQNTIQIIFSLMSIATHFLNKRFTFEGFACKNRKCSMYEAIVLLRLLQHLDEIPDKYLPEGWAVSKPINKGTSKSDLGESET